MKRIILIILALTLIVISCKKKDDELTGPGGSNGVVNTPEGNTPEGKKWARSVGGRTFTTTFGRSLKFNSFGAFEPSYETNGLGDVATITYSIAKGISEKRVILKVEISEQNLDTGKIETETGGYFGYELDDSRLLYGTDVGESGEVSIEKVDFDKMSAMAFDKNKFTSGIKDWPNIEAGSIFVSKDPITLSIGWGDYDDVKRGYKQTNDITTYGYLRIGDKGRIDVSVVRSGGGNEMPKDITRDEVIT